MAPSRGKGRGTGEVVRFGLYRKIDGRTGVGMLYQFLLLAREHTTGEQAVVYIPLRIEPEWAGTIRPCYLARAEFERKFIFVSEGLPDYLNRAGIEKW